MYQPHSKRRKRAISLLLLLVMLLSFGPNAAAWAVERPDAADGPAAPAATEPGPGTDGAEVTPEPTAEVTPEPTAEVTPEPAAEEGLVAMLKRVSSAAAAPAAVATYTIQCVNISDGYQTFYSEMRTGTIGDLIVVAPPVIPPETLGNLVYRGEYTFPFIFERDGQVAWLFYSERTQSIPDYIMTVTPGMKWYGTDWRYLDGTTSTLPRTQMSSDLVEGVDFTRKWAWAPTRITAPDVELDGLWMDEEEALELAQLPGALWERIEGIGAYSGIYP